MDENPTIVLTDPSSYRHRTTLLHPFTDTTEPSDRRPLRDAGGEGSRISGKGGRVAITGEISWTRF